MFGGCTPPSARRRVMSDQLDPRSATWSRAISLEPVTPKIREVIARTYRDFADCARAIQQHDDATYYGALSERWEKP